MQFDARAAKLLQPGAHIIVDGCPGLRLEASTKGRAWIYRYKSPVDQRMRQIKLGMWPAMAIGAATAAWEKLRQDREAGRDPAAERRATRAVTKAAPKTAGYTVRQVCDEYLAGHIKHNRKPKGQREVARLFACELGDLANDQAVTLTRARAFAFLESKQDTPIQTRYLRQELAAAWDYALDAGRLAAETPNWWRLVMRGRLRSKGRVIAGEHIGTAKRSLSEAELTLLIPWLPNFSTTVEDALTLYLWTATRGTEILGIMADEVVQEPDGLWWVVPKEKTKNARHDGATDLRVPLVGRAERVIRRRLALYPAGYLFPARPPNARTRTAATPPVPHVQQKVLGVAVWVRMPYCTLPRENDRDRLPVTRWAPHDLRRTSRTLLAKLGCTEEVAEAVIGHLPTGIAGIYNLHRYDAERRQWLTRLSDYLEELAARPAPSR